jgi:ANTAR domain
MATMPAADWTRLNGRQTCHEVHADPRQTQPAPGRRDLSVPGAGDYGEIMAPGDGGVDSQRHDMQELYERARALRMQAQVLAAQHRIALRNAEETLQLVRAARDRAEQVHALWLAAAPDADRLRYSAYARLQARLASMPVVEQAKGIIMSQCGWPEDQAFDALRGASQRENVKVRDLAARIVAQTTRSASAPPNAGARRAARPASEQVVGSTSLVLAGTTAGRRGRRTAAG